MEQLQQAIKYNNQGARLLDSGSSSAVVDALQLIREAVRVVLQDFPELGDDDGCCVAYQTISDSLSYARLQQASFQEKSVPLRNGTLYVHRRPLMIPTNTEISTHKDLQFRIQVLSSCVAFNLALTCHQFGMLSGTDAAPFERAKELYHVVLMMTPPPTSCENKNHIVASMMRCLALNNLAHLHYEQCEYEYSQYCIERLRDIMDRTNCLDSTAMTTTSDISILTVWETEEIIFNITHAKVPSAAQAA